jgi:hypothetical protein
VRLGQEEEPEELALALALEPVEELVARPEVQEALHKQSLAEAEERHARPGREASHGGDALHDACALLPYAPLARTRQP